MPKTNNFKKYIFAVQIILFTLFSLLSPTPALAADFNIQVNRIFAATNDLSKMHITEEFTVTNNSNAYFIPSTATEEFYIQNFEEGFDQTEKSIKENSIKVTGNYGEPLNFTTTQNQNNIIVKVDYPNSVGSSQSQKITLEYDTNELIEKIGKITNIYIPGLEEGYNKDIKDSQTGTSTHIDYQTKLEVPKSLGEASFTLPTPTRTTKESRKNIYEFSTESILGKTVWHQIGTEQTYHFKITQNTKKSDYITPESLDFISKNKYQLVIPREYSENNQNVEYSRLSPIPDQLERDQDNNLIATYYIDANKDQQIVIEGYITVSLDGNKEIPQDAKVSEIQNYSEMDRYLQSSEYWEVNAPEIQDKAQELSQGTDSIIKIIQADYDFIIQEIDYDEYKYGDRNERKGALAALKGGSSVCMEYSDLLITLARAQGIPARAAYGYGYDPNMPTDQQEEHQWVQVWIPDYGWMTIDPTWGDTGREVAREFIGKDIDHALWYVASQHPNQPTPLQVVSANSDVKLESSRIEINAVENIPSTVELQKIDELIDKVETEQSQVKNFTHTVQTSMIGKAGLIASPLCAGIVGVIFVLWVIRKIVKRK